MLFLSPRVAGVSSDGDVLEFLQIKCHGTLGRHIVWRHRMLKEQARCVKVVDHIETTRPS